MWWIINYTLIVSCAVFVIKFFDRLRHAINKSDRMQTFIFYLCIIIFLFMQTLGNWWTFQDIVFHGFSPYFLVVAFVVVTSIILLIYVNFVNAKYERRQKETEQRNLQYYTENLEQQYAAIRKFKHDYQNILLSLNSYIEDGDLEKLKQYYSSIVKMTSETITSEDFALENLSKIKAREIKSILAAKLMMAQNNEIKAIFEANEEIDNIPINSVDLVRMLGIILDNSIEALTELGSGELFVGCFKKKSEITFIVQNTCGRNTPPFHQIWQSGFSTKGDGRGLGLPNLLELIDVYPNVRLGTNIDKGNFIQKLTITAEVN